MKKQITLLLKAKYFAIGVFAFVGTVAAQSQVLSDETPANWKFDNQTLGNAKDLFIVEGSKIGGNLSYPFRLADSREGAFVMNSWTGPETSDYANMTEEQKQTFEDFYTACNIIDGGSKGKIFSYQGANSAVSYAGVTKNTSWFSAPSINILSKSDLPYGAYRVTLTLRILANEGTNAGSLSVYVGTSHWDGIDAASSLSDGGYRQFNIAYAPAYNDYWVTYAFDIETVENSDPDYKTYPFNIKIGLDAVANNCVFLMDDIKLEKIQSVDPAYIPMKQTAEVATAISSMDANELIVYGANGLINVIDAKETIEV